jgi:hypothetical protein
MLDSKTPKGVPYIESEEIVAKAVCEKMRCDQLHMASDDTHVDRLLFRGQDLVAVAEIKSREMSMDELENFGSYLISKSKLDVGHSLAALMGVPYMLFVRLIKDDVIVFWKVCDEYGKTLINFTVENTRTKANVNGGSVVRENAYIQLDGMKTL